MVMKGTQADAKQVDVAKGTLRRIDLNLLVFFRAVWALRSTTAAAEWLNTSQPTVSAAINRLRAQLDDPLFIWDGRRMTPTAKAEAIAPEIQDILVRIERISLSESDMPKNIKRNFIIASADYVFPSLIDAFGQRLFAEYPKLRISLVNFKQEMINRLGTMEVDLIIVPQEIIHSTGLKRLKLWTEEYLMVRSRKTPVPQTMAEMVMWPRTSFSASATDIVDHEIFATSMEAAERGPLVTTTSHLLLPSLISGTDRIGFMTPSMLAASKVPADIVAEKCKFDSSSLNLFMAWHDSRRNEPLHKFIRDAIKSSVESEA